MATVSQKLEDLLVSAVLVTPVCFVRKTSMNAYRNLVTIMEVVWMKLITILACVSLVILV